MLLTALLASMAVAAGGDWTATFGPKESGSYLDSDHAKVLVVPAGDPASHAPEAAVALVAALRQSGRADLVMTAESLGNVSALDDQSIVQRAAALPVDRVAVVRVFPGGADQPPTAVVSLYDKSGAATGALSGMAGQPIAARSASGQAEGVSSQAMSAVFGIQKQADEETREAQVKYDLQFIGFNNAAGPYQGKDKKPLQGSEFYRLVGRTDLANQYDQVSATRTTMMVIGGGGILVGTALPLVWLWQNLQTPTDVFPYLIGTGVFAVGGAVLYQLGSMMNPNPATPAEARKLADQYNTALRQRLKLPPLHASLEIGGGRVGLRLSGAF